MKICQKCETPRPTNLFALAQAFPKRVYKDICRPCERGLDVPPGEDPKATVLRLRLAEREIEKADNKEKHRLHVEKRVERRAAAKKRARAQKAAGKLAIKDGRISKELARRELARRALLQYILQFNPDYLPGWVHEDICRRLERFLEDVRAGKDPRVMLFMPPRHGKSTIASVEFPSWVLGNYPEFEVIACSYGVSLPVKFSRLVRERLRDAEYQAIFEKTRVDPENQNVEGWSTTAKGGYIPAGVGGGITGKGADILIVDDPFKDAEEADSAATRESVWNWWASTAYSRLSPKSGVIVINTRWHDDDLAGRLIQQMRDAYKEVEEVCAVMRGEGESEAAIAAYRKDELETIDAWEIISYPAIAEQDEYLAPSHKIVATPEPGARLLRRKGEALHPARYDIKKLKRKKRGTPPRYWSALYQQNPVPDEGEFFTKAMIHYGDTPDWRTLPIVIAGDLAIGQKQEHDYTALGVGCLDYTDKLHIIKVVHDRMDTYEIAEAILNLYQEFKMTTHSVMVGIERGALNLAVMPILKRRMRERKLYPSFDDELKPVTDKLIRARPLQGRMAQGMVVFPPNKNWVEPIVHDLLRFPGGVRKDRVDMLAWMVRMLSRVHAPEQTKRQKLKRQSWKAKLNKHIMGAKRGGSAMGA